MDLLPITEDDIDDIREGMDPSGHCLVCFNPCKSWSNDLFLYTCHCIYRIHPDCFKEWRRTTSTDRVCLICREEFDTFYYAPEPEEQQEQQQEQQEQQELQQRPIIIFRRYNPGMDMQIDNTLVYFFKEKICICIFFVFFTIYLTAFINIILKSIQTFRPS
jgi:hypothetical protein